MNRRQLLRLLGSAGALGAGWSCLPGRDLVRHRVLGSGPTLITFPQPPPWYFDPLTEQYQGVLMDYPTQNVSQAFMDSFTADRVSADILAVANAVGADKFAWYGYSWGVVAGLQLAVRTDRRTALVCVGGVASFGGAV